MNNNQQEQQQNMQTGSGLTRYRSAPSSYLTSLLNSPTSDSGFGAEDFAQLFNPRASSPETQRIFSRFMNSSGADTVQEDCSSHMTPPPHLQYNSQYLQTPKSEPDQVRPPHGGQRNEYSSSSSQMMYHSHNSEENKAWGSYNSNRVGHIKMEGGGGVNSGLIRHSSSPAGLFANINIEPEFGAMRGIGNFGGGNNANAEATFSSASRFNSQMDFSAKHYSSSGMMDPIIEIESKDIGESSRSDQQFEEDRANEGNYISEFMNSWDDSSLLSENFLGELADNKSEQFSNANASVDQENETGHRPTTMLSHHLSLPKTSAELSVEKLWQDTVPCKIRAKRGCATHPRSIAERVRRTKISERIRKLQELVPNMEKQTNTSDMLDLAVDYIKDLQRQVKTLSDNREKCTCSAKQGS